MFYVYRLSSGEVITQNEASQAPLPKGLAEVDHPSKMDLTEKYIYKDLVLRPATDPEKADFLLKQKADSVKFYAEALSEQVANGSRPDVSAILEAVATLTGKTKEEALTAYNESLNAMAGK